MADRSAEVLRYVREHTERVGIPPTRREIRDAVGLSSTSTVDYWLQRLVEAERVRIIPRVSRGILVTDREDE